MCDKDNLVYNFQQGTVGSRRVGGAVCVTDFGASPQETPENNSKAFNEALRACRSSLASKTLLSRCGRVEG